MDEIAKYLSPQNENVVQRDLVASIRDLAQIAITRKDVIVELEAQVRDLQLERSAFAEDTF